MFYGRMKPYSIYKPTTTDDGLGFQKETYSLQSQSLVAVIQTQVETYSTNDLKLNETTYVGYTQDAAIKKGWRVGNFEVMGVTPHRNFNVLSLSLLEGCTYE